MKIAYFIGTLKKEDGVAVVLLQLARHAKARGIENMIVTGWAEDVSISPVPVLQTPSVVFPLYKEYRLPLPGMKGFEKQLDEFKPDLIHVHSPDTSAFAALKYARRRHIPIIATHHTDFARDLAYYHIAYLEPLLWFLLRRLYNRMQAVTTPSLMTARELEEHGIKRVHAIPWGVDFARFDPKFRSAEWRQRVLTGADKPVVLCICRLTWEKDLRVLAAVYQKLREKRQDFTMVVAGDGPARAELETLMPGATFLGYVSDQKLSETYASSDILLFPSSRETFGNVTIEAMASGVVPVVADAEGSKSLVKEGETGFFAEPKNVGEFTTKMERLLDDPDLRERMRSKALEFSKSFSWDAVFENMLKLYREQLSGRS